MDTSELGVLTLREVTVVIHYDACPMVGQDVGAECHLCAAHDGHHVTTEVDMGGDWDEPFAWCHTCEVSLA